MKLGKVIKVVQVADIEGGDEIVAAAPVEPAYQTELGSAALSAHKELVERP